jgi:hypothetical protein
MKAKRPPRGPISANELYPLATFMARLGIGRSTLIEWRKRGLPLRNEGRRVFVVGRDALAWLECNLGKESE